MGSWLSCVVLCCLVLQNKGRFLALKLTYGVWSVMLSQPPHILSDFLRGKEVVRGTNP